MTMKKLKFEKLNETRREKMRTPNPTPATLILALSLAATNMAVMTLASPAFGDPPQSGGPQIPKEVSKDLPKDLKSTGGNIEGNGGPNDEYFDPKVVVPAAPAPNPAETVTETPRELIVIIKEAFNSQNYWKANEAIFKLKRVSAPREVKEQAISLALHEAMFDVRGTRADLVQAVYAAVEVAGVEKVRTESVIFDFMQILSTGNDLGPGPIDPKIREAALRYIADVIPAVSEGMARNIIDLLIRWADARVGKPSELAVQAIGRLPKHLFTNGGHVEARHEIQRLDTLLGFLEPGSGESVSSLEVATWTSIHEVFRGLDVQLRSFLSDQYLQRFYQEYKKMLRDDNPHEFLVYYEIIGLISVLAQNDVHYDLVVPMTCTLIKNRFDSEPMIKRTIGESGDFGDALREGFAEALLPLSTAMMLRKRYHLDGVFDDQIIGYQKCLFEALRVETNPKRRAWILSGLAAYSFGKVDEIRTEIRNLSEVPDTKPEDLEAAKIQMIKMAESALPMEGNREAALSAIQDLMDSVSLSHEVRQKLYLQYFFQVDGISRMVVLRDKALLSEVLGRLIALREAGFGIDLTGEKPLPDTHMNEHRTKLRDAIRFISNRIDDLSRDEMVQGVPPGAR
jgi:hypothetical protein